MAVKTAANDGLLFSQSLQGHISLCKRFVEFNEVEMAGLSESTVRYYKSSSKLKSGIRSFQAIEERWYKSLSRNNPDYSVYSSPEMVAEMWACWTVYSRGYTWNVKRLAYLLPKISSIIDLGCGVGYTTASLKMMFPRAEVIGTNIKSSFQYNAADSIGSEYGFCMSEEPESQADLVFASEYFEHHERPVEHLDSVVSTCKPKALVIANSFGSKSVGHFDEYLNSNATIGKKSIGRLFNSRLRELGYSMADTGLWNNRPTFWVKR